MFFLAQGSSGINGGLGVPFLVKLSEFHEHHGSSDDHEFREARESSTEQNERVLADLNPSTEMIFTVC